MSELETVKDAPEPGEDVILPHEYDGIEEYDNPLPGWWKWLFYGTIAWSIFYVGAIGLGFINNYEEDLLAENQQVEALAMAYEEAHPKASLDEAALAELVKAGDNVTAGQTIYDEKCASCHGDKGQGMIGPNLTDTYWLHGGALTDIHKVVAEGVPDKGMPAWGPLLKEDEVIDVVAWIHAIQGSEPAGAKAPQGQPYQPEKTSVQ